MANISVDVENVDVETLHTLLSLIESPYSAPEMLFYNLWQRKMKLKVQKSLRRTIKSFDCKTCKISALS